MTEEQPYESPWTPPPLNHHASGSATAEYPIVPAGSVAFPPDLPDDALDTRPDEPDGPIAGAVCRTRRLLRLAGRTGLRSEQRPPTGERSGDCARSGRGRRSALRGPSPAARGGTGVDVHPSRRHRAARGRHEPERRSFDRHSRQHARAGCSPFDARPIDLVPVDAGLLDASPLDARPLEVGDIPEQRAKTPSTADGAETSSRRDYAAAIGRPYQLALTDSATVAAPIVPVSAGPPPSPGPSPPTARAPQPISGPPRVAAPPRSAFASPAPFGVATFGAPPVRPR